MERAMSDAALRLKEEVLRLPDADRAALAHALYESLGDPIGQVETGAWIAELERRSAAAEAGLSAEQPFRDVIAELRGEIS
jgi:putative addiction module component (TIGR02574 family)